MVAFEASCEVHEPQHVDGVADCMVLGCGLSPSVRQGGGGVHVADDDGGGEHAHHAVCLGQGLEEGFCCVAEGDVGVDDVELPSVPDDFVDAQSPRDGEVVAEVDVDARPSIRGSPCANSIRMLSGPGYKWGGVPEGRRVQGLAPGK